MQGKHQIQRLSDPKYCLGCGLCEYVCDPEFVQMTEIEGIGLRPKFSEGVKAEAVSEAYHNCPLVHTDFGRLKKYPDYERSVTEKAELQWGAITGVWEGYAGDEEVRFKGSSGGALTAISLYCLNELGFKGVLHSAEDAEDPLRNKTRLSSDRTSLLDAVGSRYSPASVCDGLRLVENADGPCVVVGKPVEIAALRNIAENRQRLREKVGVSLSFFCAESPPTSATQSLMSKLGVSEARLAHLRYRGYGWPGSFTTQLQGEEEVEHWGYQRSWAYLQAHRPWATQIWPDGSGELADITCGDPWYEEPDGRNPGFSLIIARTQLGREIVEGAIKEGYLVADKSEEWKIEGSQRGLLRKKSSVWGRLLAHRLLGMPTPAYENLSLFQLWRDTSHRDKLASVLGTVRRIIQRGLWRK